MVAGLRGHGKDLGFARMTWDVMMCLEQRSGTLCLFKIFLSLLGCIGSLVAAHGIFLPWCTHFPVVVQ